MSGNEYGTFGELRARLDEIVVEVRNKDLSLEKSLDLYEEAIKLGNRCAELVDKPDYTAEEAAAARAATEDAQEAQGQSSEEAASAEEVPEESAEDSQDATEGE